MQKHFWKFGTVILSIVLLSAFGYFAFIQLIPENIGLISYLFNKQPANTIAAFHRNLCDGNIKETEKLLSASVPVQPEILRMGLSAGVRECKENNGFDLVTVFEQKIEGEKSSVIGEVRYNNGTKEKFNMKLYFEQQQWKIAWNK